MDFNKSDPLKVANDIDAKDKARRLTKTRAKIRAVCTEEELALFIYFIRDDTMQQLVSMNIKERQNIIDAYKNTH